MKILDLKDKQLAELIENRWISSETVWAEIEKIYSKNTNIVKNRPDWLMEIPRRRSKVRANRIQVDMEAVINSLIANPAVPNIMPARKTQESRDLALMQEQYFKQKIEDRNVKKTVRKALRNLYYSRLLSIKAFWDPTIDDFNFRPVNPKKVRISKNANGEEDSEFAIEEVDENLTMMLKRFPAKADFFLKKFGFESVDQAYIANPMLTYKEAWVNDVVIFKYENEILGKIRNPYWDWKGLLITPSEERQLNGVDSTLTMEGRRNLLTQIRASQDNRQMPTDAAQPEPGSLEPTEATTPQQPGPEPVVSPMPAPATPAQPGNIPQPAPNEAGDTSDLPTNPTMSEPETMKQYMFNYWDKPRKPYIFATIFDNEDGPIGITDMIDLANPLQEGIDKRKRDIDQNCELVNGVTKIDSQVMDQQHAESLLFEAKGIIWGKGVKDGVSRETGEGLPDMVFKDMLDSRQELDNIMRATSAFRGERQGDETKGGRLALIQQSALSLEELVQVIDFVYKEIFGWAYHLAKIRYTEYHYAKVLGKDQAAAILSIVQDDFENGAEVRIIPGKTLPDDEQFKFEMAQKDVAAGLIAPEDYFQIAGYNDPKQTAKNAVIFKMNPAYAVGISPDEAQQINPPQQPPQPVPKPPSEMINYKDAPEDIRRQMETQAGFQPSTLGGTAIQGSVANHHLERLKKLKDLMAPTPAPGETAPKVVGSK